MTSTDLKTAFRVVWAYIKKWWWTVVLAATIVFAVVFAVDRAKRIASLLDEQKAVSERHRRELAELQRLRDEEIARREAIEREYQTVVEQIRVNHAAAVETISRSKETELRRIVLESKDDPAIMAERVNNLFGIPVYRPPPP